MRFDLNRFLVNKLFVQNYFKKNGGSPGYAVSLISATAGCPVIVLAFYLAEDIGFVPELVKTIQTQINRGYRVENQPANSPFLEYS